MKMKVYRGTNIIPINIATRFDYGEANTSWEEIECNYRYIDKKTIEICSPFPFIYCLFETPDGFFNCSKFKTISLNTSTNNRMWYCKCEVQDANECAYFTNVTTDYADLVYASNDVLSKVNNMFMENFNNLLDNDNKSYNVVKLDTKPNYIMFQFTQPFKDVNFKNSVVNIPDTASENPTIVAVDMGDTTELASLGVFTYYHKLNSEELWGSDEGLLAFLGSIAGGADGLLVNAWLYNGTLPQRIPEQMIEIKFSNSEISTYVRCISEVFNNTDDIIDTITIDNDYLMGSKFWRIGENIIYPMMNYDSEGGYISTASLKSRDVLAVGNMYKIYFSGDFNDLSKYKNYCIVNQTLNNAPTVITPSAYYDNRSYQILADLMPGLQPFLGVVGGAGLGFAGAMAGGALGTAKAIPEWQKWYRERTKFSELKKVDDVLNLLPYLAGEKEVYRYSFKPSEFLLPYAQYGHLLFAYSSSENTRIFVPLMAQTQRTYFSGRPCSACKNPEFFINGFYLVNNEEFYLAIRQYC